MSRISRLALSLLALALLTRPAQAQDSLTVAGNSGDSLGTPPPASPSTPGLLGLPGTWHRLPDAPPVYGQPEHGQSSIDDPVGQRVIEFGGFTIGFGRNNALITNQPCRSLAWTVLAASGAPPSPRFGHSAVYDPIRKRMILFGGENGAPSGELFALSLTGTPTWSVLSAAGTGPTPRYGHDAIYDPIRDRMIVFGGFDGVHFLNEVWSLDLSGTPTWSLLTPAGAPPARRDYAGAIYDPVRDRLLVFGGNDGTVYNDLWSLNLAGPPAWTPIAATGFIPAGRLAHVTVYDPVNDAMVIVGGAGGPGIFYDDVRILSLAGTPNWQPATGVGGDPITPGHSRGASYVPEIAGIICHGGVNSFSSSETDEIALGPPLTNRRIQGVALNRDGQIMVVDPVRRRILMHGGQSPFLNGDLLQMALDGPGRWDAPCVLGPSPSPRHGHAGIYDPVRDRLLMFGGYDGGYLNDLWQLSLGSPMSWSGVPTSGTPPIPRDYASMIYDGSRDRIVLFGGNNNGVFSNDVWVLSLAGVPTWAPLAPGGPAPSGRLAHRAVYDAPRDRMLVFGGFDGAQELNDVWALQFTPTLQWVQLSPAGPFPVGRHSAGLIDDTTRDRLVLFGGYDGLGSRNDLWELPLTGPLAWAPMVAPPVTPPERHGQGTIYDPINDLMVVMGGYRSQGGGDLADTWVLNWGGGAPTPTLVSLVSSDARPGRVRLTWQGASTVSVATVLRREGASPWTSLGAVHAIADQWTWEDIDVRAGAHYTYALDFGAGPQAQIAIEVPAGPRLALVGMRPNPIDANSRLLFSLPATSRVRIEAFDVAGRRAAVEDLGVLAAGSHRVPFAGLARLGAGVYTLKLSVPDGVRTARAVLVR